MSRLIFLLAAALLAPQATQVEITNEPHHHLVFENQSIRVFNVEVDPNTETQMHWHRHDYFAVTLAPAEIANTVLDKPAVTTKLTEGDVRFASATFAHSVRDVGPEPFRNVTVEILEDATLRNSPAKWDTGKNDAGKNDAGKSDAGKSDDRGLEVLANGTAQILFVKDGIRATEFELQPGGVVPMHHHSGPHLLVAVTDCDIRSDVKSDSPSGPQGPMPAHFKSGDSKWLPGNYSHTITNTGAKPAKFVTLEFPE